MGEQAASQQVSDALLYIFQGLIPNSYLGSRNISNIRIMLTSSGGDLSALLTSNLELPNPKAPWRAMKEPCEKEQANGQVTVLGHPV